MLGDLNTFHPLINDRNKGSKAGCSSIHIIYYNWKFAVYNIFEIIYFAVYVNHVQLITPILIDVSE